MALALPAEFLAWLRDVPPELVLLHALGGVLGVVAGVLAIVRARRHPEGPERLLLVVTAFCGVVVGTVSLTYWAFLQYGECYAEWQRVLLAGPLLAFASIALLLLRSPSRRGRRSFASAWPSSACSPTS